MIGALVPSESGEPASWRVTFSVADRDESASRAEKLGAAVLSSSDQQWSRRARLRDPQGAEFVVSQFTPPPRPQ